MKRWTLIGLALLIVGALTTGVSMALMGFDLTKLNTETSVYLKREYVAENRNQNIEVSDNNMSIIVATSNDDKIHFIYYDQGDSKYKIEDDEELSIDREFSKAIVNHVGLSFGKPTVNLTVLLPADYTGQLEVDTSNGNVEGSNFKVGSLSAQSTNGDIKFDSVTVLGDTDLETVSGDILITNLSSGGNVELETSKGDIKGNILGKIESYYIDAKTTLGDCNLPKTSNGGPQKLEVRTNAGDIDIKFM